MRAIPLERDSTLYLDRLPFGLRRALFAGHWLPVIGAGISASARTDDGRRPPLWPELGRALGEEVWEAPDRRVDHVDMDDEDNRSPSDGYAVESRDRRDSDVDIRDKDRRSNPDGNPIDAISAFAELYGRVGLIDRLTELLLVDEVEPSEVQLAFARLPFDMVVTTNADFLLETAYQYDERPCVPILGESQLSGRRRPESTYLLKLHGDLRHPDDLVMTEDDYDGFLRRKPLLATYLSWWLLTREPVLFGYSLDDADLREVLALLRERLGKLTRAGWAILPTDRAGRTSAKFARRGIRAIVLDDDPEAVREKVLTRFFQELREAWESQVLTEVTAPTDAMTAELRRA